MQTLWVEENKHGWLLSNGKPVCIFDDYESALKASYWKGPLALAAAPRVYLLHSPVKIGSKRSDSVRNHYGNGPRVQEYSGPHAYHYIGYTNRQVTERLEDHLRGDGSAYARIILEAGAKLVRVWYAGHKFEHYLKHSIKNAPWLCPVCSKRAMNRLADVPSELVRRKI